MLGKYQAPNSGRKFLSSCVIQTNDKSRSTVQTRAMTSTAIMFMAKRLHAGLAQVARKTKRSGHDTNMPMSDCTPGCST